MSSRFRQLAGTEVPAMLNRTVALARLRMRPDVRASWLTHIANADGITCGRGVVLDREVSVKGGESGDCALLIGDQVTIRAGSYVSARRGQVAIGDHGYLGHYTWIGGQGVTRIGPWFLCAPHVVIVSSNHDFRQSNRPYALQEEIPSTVVIGRNVWVGAGSVILPGTQIGDHAVIGAGSVVTGDVPGYSLAAGVPAEVIRTMTPAVAEEMVLRGGRWQYPPPSKDAIHTRARTGPSEGRL